MVLTDLDHHFVRANDAFARLFGYSPAEILTLSMADITHPDDLEADLENVRKMLSGEIKTYQMEKRYLHKSGSVVWILLSVSLVRTKSGEPLFFIGQIQDITRRKLSEEQLAKATAQIKRLQERLLKICTWTKRIYVDGKWISVDKFLTEHLHLKLTPATSVPGEPQSERE